MNNPKVSVIMPSLNVGEYIRECMESVINQTLKDIEIICVDAGSTDGTLEILQEYASKDSRIKIINSEKKSYGYQMNVGIKSAKGEYIGIVETDDFIDLNMYEELYNLALENDVDLIKEDFKRFITEEGINVFFLATLLIDESVKYEQKIIDKQKTILWKTRNYIWPGIYKKSFIDKNKILFNESSGASYQDNGFWFITSVYASKVFFHKGNHYNLRRDNPNSSIFNKNNVYKICGEYDYILNFLKKDSLIYDNYIK